MDRTSDPEKIEKLKAGIRHSIDRGAKLTQQLLTFARKSPLHPEVVDIGMRLRSMDTLLERSLGENFSVDYRIAPQLWPVEVDPSQLEVALLNIVLNARDAMPGGGRIIISVENETGRDGDWVRISVADRSEEHTSELQSLMRRSYAVFCLIKKIKQRSKYQKCSITHQIYNYSKLFT